MPTTQVEPASHELLQDIANTLWKSRKVVVITGAGISTNSGIPDFRSENGLYSLIQAQFDAAAAGEAAGNTDDADESDMSSQGASERPSKRRRISRNSTNSAPDESSDSIVYANGEVIQARGLEIESERERGQFEGVAGADTPRRTEEDALNPPPPCETDDRLPKVPEPRHDAATLDVKGLEHAPGPPDEAPGDQPVTPNRATGVPLGGLTPLPSPMLPGRHESAGGFSGRVRMEPHTHFASSPPSTSLDGLQPRLDSDPTHPQTISSSPLSSPPPILFDPYQASSRRTSSSPSPSSSQDSASSGLENEDSSSSSTPLLTSQSSFGSSSSRHTLPNLKGRDLFDAQIWSCPIRTSVFYTFATTLRQKVRDAEPTSSHQFVSTLRNSRKLVRCYTQNIDQLEERVGLTTSLELGPGSRYRFSARSGRNSGGTRGPIKDSETSSLSQVRVNGPDGETLVESQAARSGSQQPDTSTSQLGGFGDTKLGDQDVSAAIPTAAEPSSQLVSDVVITDVPTLPAASVIKPASTPPNRGVECVFLHGSLAELRCFVCGRTSSWDDDARQADTLAGRQPTCPHCAGATAAREERGKRALGVGKLRPDIVLYGEEHPHAHLISPIVQHDLSLGPDMLLILGTSMRVHGLKVLVREFAKAVHDRGGKVVFVNFTKPPESVWADIIDYWVQWDCDAWVGDLQKRKPALWLPPGTVIPREDKPKKIPKASRRTSGGESGKRKDDSSGISKANKESDRPVKGPAGRSRKEGGRVKKEAEEPEIVANPLPERAPKPPSETAPDLSLGTAPTASSETSPIAPWAQVASPPASSPPPPPPGPALAPPSLPRKLPRVTREPKLNPDAKRPASVRDHKLNGAYLVWKIMGDLHRITGNSAAAASAASSALQPKPKTKRARKSAPAALLSRDTTTRSPNTFGDLGDAEIKEPTKESLKDEKSSIADVPNPVPWAASLSTSIDQESSISTAVKSRKRKRTTWKMIRGVETRVDLDAEDGHDMPRPKRDAETSNTEVVSKLSSAPPRSRALPRPTPSLPPPTPTRHLQHAPHIPPLKEPGFDKDIDFDSGFSETDRLIAELNNNLGGGGISTGFERTDRFIAKYNLQATRPTTPVLQLPLQLAPLRNQQTNKKTTTKTSNNISRPKLQPLEPKVMSPGPQADLSPNVGSPPLPTPTVNHDGNAMSRACSNAFFFVDPLTDQLQYPPSWLDRSYEKSEFQVYSPYCASPAFGGQSIQDFGPEDQLRREQEAAMMLSMMGTAGGGGQGHHHGHQGLF
ncbi:hypothetical protein B0H66DRAFT_219855 [Apodospora peruviana]|uniref:Deacetylase sirtuin-type domain-containing protein n=1 Tax=Apodospora peruviana TaxID=516989 RepID=A0AAE0I3W7_9PEZI|nr:hypothetical protein B0H66DRAFT_219855 [Apodospora peruviana]